LGKKKKITGTAAQKEHGRGTAVEKRGESNLTLRGCVLTQTTRRFTFSLLHGHEKKERRRKEKKINETGISEKIYLRDLRKTTGGEEDYPLVDEYPKKCRTCSGLVEKVYS